MKTVSRYRLSQSEFICDVESDSSCSKLFKQTRDIIDSYYIVNGNSYALGFNHVELLTQWNSNRTGNKLIEVYNTDSVK